MKVLRIFRLTFEFPKKISLKMLNSANYISDLFTDNLNTNHLNLKLLGGGGGGGVGILQVLSHEFLKIRILEIMNF